MRRLLIYGDSNSFGTAPIRALGDDAVHRRGDRWGEVLAGRLGAGWDVVIEGLPGRTSVFDDPVEGAFMNGLAILPAILRSHRPIDLLAVCLGTNDQKLRFGLGAEDIALGVGRLVREALASGFVGKALIVSPPPARERGCLAAMFAGAEARAAGLAGHMARVARTEGAAFFDAGSVIAVDELDGVHWSAAAHRVLAEALEAPVREILG